MKKIVVAATLALSLFSLSLIFNPSVSASSKVAEIIEKKSFLVQTADILNAVAIDVPTNGANYIVFFDGSLTDTASCNSGIVDIMYVTDFQAPLSLHSTIEVGLTGNQKLFSFHAAGGTQITISTIHTQDACSSTYNFYAVVQEL